MKQGKLIMLIGRPGSGKTTYAENLIATNPNEIVRVSQDVNKGDRTKTWDEYKRLLDSGVDVILDRCNISVKQRSPWINYAKQHNYKIEGVYLAVSREVCVERILTRANHETVPSTLGVDKIEGIVRAFTQEYERPELTEGFDSITFKRNE